MNQRDHGFGAAGFGGGNAGGFGGAVITDEKRNEWLEWIDYHSKQYSIEPAANGNFNQDTLFYKTSYGTLEVQKQLVENYVTKPVDTIFKLRAKRDPLVIPQHETGPSIIPSIDPPYRYDLMDLMINHRIDYTKFCEDVYENNQDLGMVCSDRSHISFDEATGEFCFKLIMADLEKNVKTLGM